MAAGDFRIRLCRACPALYACIVSYRDFYRCHVAMSQKIVVAGVVEILSTSWLASGWGFVV